MKHHAAGNKYAAVDNPKSVALQIRCTKGFRLSLRNLAARNKRSVSEYLTALVERELEQEAALKKAAL